MSSCEAVPSLKTLANSIRKADRVYGVQGVVAGSQLGEFFVRGSEPGSVYRVEVQGENAVCPCRGYEGHGFCYHCALGLMAAGVIDPPHKRKEVA